MLLGLGFRVYTQAADFLNIQTKICYTVNRGYNQPPVQSCEGRQPEESPCFNFQPTIRFKIVGMNLKLLGAQLYDFHGCDSTSTLYSSIYTPALMTNLSIAGA